MGNNLAKNDNLDKNNNKSSGEIGNLDLNNSNLISDTNNPTNVTVNKMIMNADNQLSNERNSEISEFSNQNQIQMNGGPSSEPSSRNNYLDESNHSFSNSATPDQSKKGNKQILKDRTPTPLPTKLNEINKPANQLINQNSSSSIDNSNSNKIVKYYESQLMKGIKVPQKKLRLKKM